MGDDTRDSMNGPPLDAEWLVNQIAHTLRNPIFAAMVQAEALVLRAGGDEGISNAAQLVFRQLKRLEDNINEMLLYGRPARVNPRRVDVLQLVETVAARFRDGERSPPARIELSTTAPSIQAVTDPDAVTVILDRLLRNAVDHTPEPHDVALRVSADDELRLVVRDRGEGIPQNVQERMFLPFFPQHSGRAGLGLSVAAKFAHALGGRIEIESEEGAGTVASCILPLTAPEP